MNTNDENIESKIKESRIELEKANKKDEKKYNAPVPLRDGDPICHELNEMKRDQDNRNKIRDEHFALMRQRRDKK
jgi:hypothetical protein